MMCLSLNNFYRNYFNNKNVKKSASGETVIVVGTETDSKIQLLGQAVFFSFHANVFKKCMKPSILLLARTDLVL